MGRLGGQSSEAFANWRVTRSPGVKSEWGVWSVVDRATTSRATSLPLFRLDHSGVGLALHLASGPSADYGLPFALIFMLSHNPYAPPS